jgi:hypothetical protein
MQQTRYVSRYLHIVEAADGRLTGRIAVRRSGAVFALGGRGTGHDVNFGPGDGHVPPARVGRDHALDVGMHRPCREDDRVGHRQTGTSTGPLVTPQLRGTLGGRAIHIEHPHLRVDQELLCGSAGLPVAVGAGEDFRLRDG